MMQPAKLLPSVGQRPAARPICASLAEECGGTLIEYAIVILVFLMILFGIAGFGHALYSYHFVSNAAREATRWAAVNGSTCADDGSCKAPASSADIQSYVTNHIPLGIDSSKITTTPSWPVTAGSPPICSKAVNGIGPTPNAPGCTVAVQVSYTFSFLFPFLSSGPLTLSSSSELVIAH